MINQISWISSYSLLDACTTTSPTTTSSSLPLRTQNTNLEGPLNFSSQILLNDCEYANKDDDADDDHDYDDDDDEDDDYDDVTRSWTLCGRVLMMMMKMMMMMMWQGDCTRSNIDHISFRETGYYIEKK